MPPAPYATQLGTQRLRIAGITLEALARGRVHFHPTAKSIFRRCPAGTAGWCGRVDAHPCIRDLNGAAAVSAGAYLNDTHLSSLRLGVQLVAVDDAPIRVLHLVHLDLEAMLLQFGEQVELDAANHLLDLGQGSALALGVDGRCP